MNPLNLKISRGTMMIRFRGDWIALDPKRPVRAKYVFVSHAHSDHVPTSLGGSKLIASNETAEILRARGIKVNGHAEEMKGLELADAGHILGSRSILVEGRVFYTGDIAGRPRAFLDKAKVKGCETLIIESTYGMASYRFPPLATIVKDAMTAITRAFERGKGIALLGYSLGKAQLLTYLFQSWHPLYIYRTVALINSTYESLGIDLPNPDLVINRLNELPRNRPFLLIAPNNPSIKNRLLRMGIRPISFTGWALRRKNNGLPLSDHADFSELVNFVRASRPEKVYTVFGYAKEFAEHLRCIGYHARPITSLHAHITDFFE